jgi:hypothetical protein
LPSAEVFYTHTLNRQIAIEHIPLPRYQRKLPVILSRQCRRCPICKVGRLIVVQIVPREESVKVEATVFPAASLLCMGISLPHRKHL